ncbi:MAG TPA: DUF4863 family protein [Enhygromyxa sp.]|nr:DUF4863 family protein [Enhygromyxa sp.]
MSEAIESTTELLSLLAPILARVAELDVEQRTTPEAIRELEATLEREYPHAGSRVQAIGELLARGVREGWLADRGAPEARFGRLAKPGPATCGLSIDIVSMIGAGIEHSHPHGEITIGFLAEPEDGPQSCHFESRPPGWVVLGPDSRHVPTVTGARMNLIYFLPGGAVEWHFPPRA